MPLFWLSLTFLSGILLGHSLSLSIYGWYLIALITFISLLPPIYHLYNIHLLSRLSKISDALRITTPALYPLMVLVLSLGVIRYQLSQPRIDPSFIAYYNDQPTKSIIDAVIVDFPDVRDTYVNLRLRTEKINSGTNQANPSGFSPVHGLLLARVPVGTTYHYGDRLRLQGYLTTPPENEDFSYRDYLANHGIYSYLAYSSTSLLQTGQGDPIYSLLYALRQHALDLVYSYYPDPEASLIAGIVLGVQSGIPQDVQDAFRLTGTSHIIVISGFNITIIAGMFTLLFSRLLGRYKGAIAAALGIILYTMLVGANPAVVRAALLGLLTLLASQVGRRQVGLNSLAFIAAVMAVITPTVLWDVSFQLTFAATLGIVLYAEPLTQSFVKITARFMPPDKADTLAGPVSEYFLLTLAALLTTLPLMIYYFKRLSLTALVANPLILPAQPPLEVLGILSILAGLLFKPLGQLLAWAAWPFTAYTIRVVEWLSAVPHGSIPLGQVALPLIVLFYAFLFAITFMRVKLPVLLRNLSPAIPLASLAILAVLVWKVAFYAPDGLLHVTMLNVGTGDAVLIQSASGRSVLINGGPSMVALSDALGRRLPPFDRSLD
jgi:competence protein ComEC